MSENPSNLTINRPYLAEQLVSVIDELINKARSKGLMNKKHVTRTSLNRSDKTTAFLRDLNLQNTRSFTEFIDCLREVKKSRLAEILERGGTVVKVNVSFKIVNDWSSLEMFVLKLNDVSNYSGPNRIKLRKITSWLKNSDTDILESVLVNNSCVSIWLCCWTEGGLSRMKTSAESDELFRQFKKLFNCLTQITGLIKPVSLEFDAAKQLAYMPAVQNSEDEIRQQIQHNEHIPLKSNTFRVKPLKKAKPGETKLFSTYSELSSENTSYSNQPTERTSLQLSAENKTCEFCFGSRLKNKYCQECKKQGGVLSGSGLRLPTTEIKVPLSRVEQCPILKDLVQSVGEKCHLFTTESEMTNFDKILNILGVEEYYPHKLFWIDIVTVEESKFSEMTCLNIVRGLMRLDYTALYANISAFHEVNDNPENLANSNEADQIPGDDSDYGIPDGINCIHPMDVLNVILNSCDENLLQILMGKLFQCQLSIPFILPDMGSGSSTCHSWALRMITPECKIDSNDVRPNTLSLVEIQQPVISFMRIGDLFQSKSRLLNSILRVSSHDTFFHRDCKNGGSERQISNGTIEATWFQPSEDRNDKFQRMFTILNLRGDASEHLNEAALLCRMASLNFIMIGLKSLTKKTYRQFVDSCVNRESAFVLIFVASSTKNGSKYNSECRECIQYFRNIVQLYGVHYNWTQREFLNDERRKSLIQSVICKYFRGAVEKKTILDLIENVREYGRANEKQNLFLVDEDDPTCKHAFQKAIEVLAVLENIKPTQRKTEFIPLQGEPWKSVTELHKELHRKSSNSILSLEKYIPQKEIELKNARHHQFELFQESGPKFIRIFYLVLMEYKNSKQRQYFINWVRIFLDSNSRCDLPELHMAYHAKWDEYQPSLLRVAHSEAKTQHQHDLSAISNKIADASFGIEHLFRELGQIFEAVKCTPFAETANNVSLRWGAIQLPNLMAELMLQGCSLELMDGETAFVPITWIKAVLEKIRERIKEKRLFIISIVGMQSSGKSTFLNTMFGLEFAVSAGRCTRGVFCQMIPVNKCTLNVDYDYILIVDTEGLGAPELQDTGNNHDNELATFVIGLGNVTIVNIKGEADPNLQDVLQIVIHAMLRIKFLSRVQLNPSCIFVHQNVSAANAEEKLKFGKENLLMLLDRVTAAAAAQEHIENIEQFKQVIDYDKYKHAVYLPDLWQGNPPMAPVNYGYSERIYDVRQMLINDISKKATTVTIKTFASKLEDLWNGILSEDFVFSFRNSEEVRAYSMLDKFFSQMLWESQSASSAIQEEVTNGVFSSIIRSNDELIQLQEQLKSYMTQNIADILEEMQFELNEFFNNNSNKDILEQWRERYSRRLISSFEDDQERLNKVIKEYCTIKFLQLQTDADFDQIKNDLMKDIQKLALKYKHENQPTEESNLHKYFAKFWKSVKIRFKSSYDPKNDVDIVLTAIEASLRSSFSSHSSVLDEELFKFPLNNLENCSFNRLLNVNRNDIVFKHRAFSKVKNWFKSEKEKYINAHCLKSAQEECNKIAYNVKKYVSDLVGQDFQPSQVTHTIWIMMEFFDRDPAKNGFTFTHQFRIQFTVYICKCAAKDFIGLRSFFREKTNPTARISEYRLPFYQYFKSQCNQIDEEYKDSDSASLVAQWFIDWISQEVSNHFNRILVESLAGDSTFDSKVSFMRRLLSDLIEDNNFDSYMTCITNHEKFLADGLRSYVENWRADENNKNTLEKRVRKETRKLKSNLIVSIKELEGPFTNLEFYIQEIGKRLRNQIPYDTRFTQTVKVINFDTFTKYLIQFIEKDKTEASYILRKAITTSDSVIDQLAGKIIGCLEKCPFCQAPCCLTEKEHAGDHRAMQHYPMGFFGFVNSGKLCTYNCHMLLSYPGIMFTFDSNNPEESTQLARSYRKFHPNWKITPDRSMQTSLYWKRVMANFNNELAQYYNSSPAHIAEQWRNITVEMARNSLDNF